MVPADTTTRSGGIVIRLSKLRGLPPGLCLEVAELGRFCRRVRPRIVSKPERRSHANGTAVFDALALHLRHFAPYSRSRVRQKHLQRSGALGATT